ncbi:cytochrome c oxidase subunit 3 family protein [Ketobacter sp. MCCC 1A13808]|uniref:cytochrome c oxidase subunit 3 n=1 Tax=Ketobacter sp. MCCC 1A13808 TaxID=2602738 RepID=UPI000F149953|nr:cytochrome c oxidase subunit 3 [Ketobacter sp. MCCC 1A13808]MVF13547.1 cytochrome c oxidase subunit 3 family protein [Ketobacter sp. MCCC 1A13808]RLP53346.1 MAG: cytochrome c oxidase subunit 3 family protein [Ketobacter sp.]
MSNAPVLTFNDSKPHLPGESSMWFFIVGDLLIFGVYFVVYMYYRGQEPALFLQNQQYLSQEIGVINTVILLTSSLFVALSTEAARKNNNSEAFKLMGIALLFGLIFPCLKIIEWIPKISSGMTPGENLFFMFYYLMTGLHLCHVILGLIILMFVMREFRPSHQANVTFVETGSTYWHMVDLLWLVLYALLYLMR